MAQSHQVTVVPLFVQLLLPVDCQLGGHTACNILTAMLTCPVSLLFFHTEFLCNLV